MDYRDVLVDGLDQLNDWLADAIREVSEEQMNWLPPGKALSIGFNAWHIVRTHDNIVNFVFQRKQPIWVDRGYFERFNLPKVDQGTGMGFDDARALRISDAGLLREYASEVAKDVSAFVRAVPLATLDEMQMVRPMGEMPKWKIVRQVLMTHGFMHLGEINTLRGMQGLQFFM